MSDDIKVAIAKLEQRLTDHERLDEKKMWAVGIFVAALLGTLGTMWTNLSVIDGRQQVVLSTIVDVRAQIAGLRTDMGDIRTDLRQQHSNSYKE